MVMTAPGDQVGLGFDAKKFRSEKRLYVPHRTGPSYYEFCDTPIERKRSIEAVSIQLSALSLRSFKWTFIKLI